MEEKKKNPKPHSLMLDNRKSLTVSGVSNVDSFDEGTVVAYTDFGELVISGKELSIDKLSIETGELVIKGEISALVYSDDKPTGSIFSRIFR